VFAIHEHQRSEAEADGQPPEPHSLGQAEILGPLLRKDEVAMRGVMQRHSRRLYRLARTIVRSDSEAEDVVQDSYVRAFARLATFRGESDLGTWLGRIVINEALGLLRRAHAVTGGATSEAGRPFAGQVIPFPLAGEQIDPERYYGLNAR
jgi:RNA polymerase sigma-70 factor (ECF subfamily)